LYKKWLNLTARFVLHFCLPTNLQCLLLAPMSDGLPDKSRMTLLIPISLRVSAQGEKLLYIRSAAGCLDALGSVWCDGSSTCCKHWGLMEVWMDLFSAEWLGKPPASWRSGLGVHFLGLA